MVDVAFAAAAALVHVRFAGHRERTRDHRGAGLWVPPFVRGENRCKGIVGGLVLPTPRQHAVNSAHWLVDRQALYEMVAKASTTIEATDFEQEAESDDDSPKLFDEPARCCCGAASGEHIVDDQHSFAGVDGVAVHLEFVGAVLEAVFLTHDSPRQFARLAHRNKSGVKQICNRSCNDEATSLHAEHTIDLEVLEALDQALNGSAETIGVTEQRGDVPKDHALGGIISDLSHEAAKPRGVGHRNVGIHACRLANLHAVLLGYVGVSDASSCEDVVHG